jgi:hypothetical protein
MPRPELYVSGAGSLFDEEGRLEDEATRKRLRRLLEALPDWAERNGI